MYLDTLSYTEKHGPLGHFYVFKGPCLCCKEVHEVKVRGEELFKVRQGGYIQSLSNTPGEREFLLTGICDKGWDKMFPEEEE